MSVTAAAATAGTVARSDSGEWMPPLPTKAGGAKCATVTMLLAQRIARNECSWSVDKQTFYGAHKMNVWQTLEYLSGVSLKKRYNYEGFVDTHNVIRTLTPSWRRDSFAEKSVKADEANAKFVDDLPGTVSGVSAGGISTGAPQISSPKPRVGITITRASVQSNDNLTLPVPPGVKVIATQRQLRSGRKKKRLPELDPEYALSPEDLQDLVKCNFNLPRISARLERLMGTNVVKLTDRAYMKELRERIDDDYRKQLQGRIKAREAKEIERERLLIIEGKTDIIPVELADDPIFMVNKDATIEIQKERSKLKTAREKNAERLKQQGVKWERERLQHEAKEADLLAKKQERQRQQKLLIEQYKAEDEERGMDLLRIENEDWRDCEQNLKEFLEKERNRMKYRTARTPVQFSSDPLDIQNIVRARQKFRETELKIRHQLDDKTKDTKVVLSPSQLKTITSEMRASDNIVYSREQSIVFEENNFQDIRQKYRDDATDISSESEESEVKTRLSAYKQQYAEELQEELDDELDRGLLISKQQYDQLRYEDEKIIALRNAKDIRELYQLAEEIIMGEVIPEEEVVPVAEETQVAEFVPPSDDED